LASNDGSEPEGAKTDKAETKTVGFATFLESVPAQQLIRVAGVWRIDRSTASSSRLIATPDLKLHCDTCNGDRVFRFSEGDRYLRTDSSWTNMFINHRCSNCQQDYKMYSLQINTTADDLRHGEAHCYKFGEMPPFGAPTPNRLLRLFGKDSSVFLKGRQCENHGLGIGAFGYYRRVVESHKDQLFDEIIKVSNKIAPELVPNLEAARKENQFLKAVEAVKDGIPQSLLINGHNPLTLLHAALSEGLHAQTDEQCLELAHHVRVVLSDLVERMSQAMKDEAELNAAITRLMSKKEP
jgi:hypothetical protein